MIPCSSRGFSLVELVVAMALTIGVAALVFSAVMPSESAFAAQTEKADMQQRLRVAADALGRDLEAAGAGPSVGMHQGPLTRAFAAVLPYRLGSAGSPPGSVSDDTLTVVTVPPTRAQTTIALPFTPGSGAAVIQLDPGCPLGSAACGFVQGMTVMVFDGTGAIDLFTVRAVAGLTISLDQVGPSSGHIYPSGSGLAEVQVRVFSRRTDASGVEQLVREGNIGAPAVPVVDHVVDLAFEFFGDPVPPGLRPGADPDHPDTTYGPSPPPGGVQTTAYPPGENCLFAYMGGRVARLPTLSANAGPLVRLTGALLSDGPWCPDALHPLRFDADLLRLRRVSMRVRVQSAIGAFRGPAGPLFARGGTGADGRRLLPDAELRLSVAPSNLGLVLPP